MKQEVEILNEDFLLNGRNQKFIEIIYEIGKRYPNVKRREQSYQC